MVFPGGSAVKNLPACNAGDLGSVPGLGRSPGGGNGNPLQYSCLGNLMDRGAWRAIDHRGHKRVRHDLVTRQQYISQHAHVHVWKEINWEMGWGWGWKVGGTRKGVSEKMKGIKVSALKHWVNTDPLHRGWKQRGNSDLKEKIMGPGIETWVWFTCGAFRVLN